MDRAPAEIDVAPAQRKDLPHPQAGKGRGVEDRRILLILRHAHQRQDLLRPQDLNLRRPPHPWPLDDVDGVGGSP